MRQYPDVPLGHAVMCMRGACELAEEAMEAQDLITMLKVRTRLKQDWDMCLQGVAAGGWGSLIYYDYKTIVENSESTVAGLLVRLDKFLGTGLQLVTGDPQ